MTEVVTLVGPIFVAVPVVAASVRWAIKGQVDRIEKAASDIRVAANVERRLLRLEGAIFSKGEREQLEEMP